ncbi:MAG TPA: alpha/beta hydrolase [Pilimelia sp.]|nr:alpha/beta hydrolase [Pilimelia sp.]
MTERSEMRIVERSRVRAGLLYRVERRALHTLVGLPPRLAGRLAGAAPPPGDGGVLDPTIRLILALQRARGLAGLTSVNPELTRVRMRQQVALAAGRPTRVATVHPVQIPGPEGPLTARHYVPLESGGPHPLLVFFHGGGFVAGSVDSHDEPCRILCRYGGVHVLSVSYRLAPEHPFPAGVEDAYAAAQWAMRHAGRLGADPERVGIGGDSAGGNLATVACLLAVRREAARPAAQVLLYPPTDYMTAWPSREAFAQDLLLTGRDIEFCYRHYAPDADADDERHSPLRSTDLVGMPPAMIVTAAFDPLRDEGEAYADALRKAGNRVVDWRVPGMVHGFFNLTALSRTARDAAIGVAGAVRALLTVSGPAGTAP